MPTSKRRQILSGKSDSAALWNPMTPPIPSHAVAKVRFSVENDSSGLLMLPGIQYSDDGISWDGAEEAAGAGSPSYTSTTGLTHWNIVLSCPGDFSSPTERLFVRFGLWVKNVTGTAPRAGSARLTVDVLPVVSGSRTADFDATPSSGSTTTRLFTPMIEMSATEVTEVRCSWEQESNSGLAETQPGYQTSDDQVTWTAASTLGSVVRTTEGTTYGDSWTSVAINTKRFVRFGILTRNVSGSDVEGCVSSLRVDWRS